MIRNKCEEIFNSQEVLLPLPLANIRRLGKEIKWYPPDGGVVKLNIDVVCKGPFYLAAAGGVLKDSNGKWLSGFMFKIGNCTPVEAELWAILEGLKFVWDTSHRRLILESDSLTAILAIQGGHELVGNCHLLVHRIREMLSRGWSVKLQHVFREQIHVQIGLQIGLLMRIGA